MSWSISESGKGTEVQAKLLANEADVIKDLPGFERRQAALTIKAAAGLAANLDGNIEVSASGHGSKSEATEEEPSQVTCESTIHIRSIQ